MEALREAELRWPLDTHEFVVISLGTGLGSLLRNNLDNEEVATKLKAKSRKSPINFEQISKQLWSVANDTELTHADTERCFTKW